MWLEMTNFRIIRDRTAFVLIVALISPTRKVCLRPFERGEQGGSETSSHLTVVTQPGSQAVRP